MACTVNATADPEFCLSEKCSVLQRVISATRNATKTIDASVYKFTSVEVYHALVDAMDAGVKVRLVVDSVENALKTSYANKLKAKGADIKFWTKAKLHAKLAIYDGTYPRFFCPHGH
jgi:phosphatidylserine/phosphatidylglycerophosphate/cardiolipin synthase-like enzyme